MNGRNRHVSGLLLAVVGLLVVAGTPAAQACFMISPQPVQVWLDHIHVDIVDQVAVKTYNCTFRNPNSQAIVGGTCYMELEPGAQVDDMSVWVNGQEMRAEILDVDKAKQVFADLVKKGHSPALLEYFGNQLIQTQVPRVPPNGTVTVKLKYTTVLKRRGDLVRLQMLNTNPKALMQPLKSASVSVNIRSRLPIKNLYSPTHEINIGEAEGWDVTVNWAQEDYLPKHPFVLYYQTAEEPVGATVLAHRELDEDGTFMLMLSPTIGQGAGAVSDKDILPKDVVFCVDTSGSMLKDGKIEQARAALRYCIEKLRPGDRFNIVDFSTTARHFRDGLVEVDEQTRAEALRYADKLAPRGGTAIEEALGLSLKQLSGDDGRLKMVVFATDGLPTIGETDPEALLKKMAEQNRQDVRIFVFGEGFDVNTKLLDFLALEHRGEADYILPEENITEKIARFFDRVGSPIMTDLELSFEGLEVYDVFPRKIPDVYKGEQVVVYGRYRGHGDKVLRLTANMGGTRKTLSYELSFPEYSEDDSASFVPRLWAGRKVDYLLSEIRKSGMEDEELINEVTALAKRYGIVTPYTSFLVADDVVTADTPQLGMQLRGRLGRALAPAGADAAAKRDRVLESKALAEARRAADASGGAAGFYNRAEEQLRKAGRSGPALGAIRYIGSRTFYKSGPTWFESTYEPDKVKNVKVVEVGSDEYIELLLKHPRIAKYLALGDVTLQIDKTWYRFETPKKKS